MPTRRTTLTVVAAALGGCGRLGRKSRAEPEPPEPSDRAWYTHPQPSGNRRLAGRGDIRAAEPVEFSPDGRPQWLVARPGETGSRWTVATADGAVTDWHVADGTATRARSFGGLPAGTQPVIRRGPSGTDLLDPPDGLAARASPIVSPRRDGRASKLLYVAERGTLVVAGQETTRLAIDAIPDGRLAAVGDGRYACFGDRTDRYRHGALGDSVEGETLYVVDADDAEVVARATLDAPVVFEGIQPLVADLDGDGDPEIVTTVADEHDGARIAVFSPDGRRIATGPVYGPGWRHQLAVAPFGPDGRPELAVVRKPHVDRVAEFYRLNDGALDVVATAEGVSSHTYGSRILSGAVAGQFAGAATELLVPTAEREALAAVRRASGSASVAWRLPLNGTLASNVTGVSLDGGVAVGAATDQTVSVWQA